MGGSETDERSQETRRGAGCECDRDTITGTSRVIEGVLFQDGGESVNVNVDVNVNVKVNVSVNVHAPPPTRCIAAENIIGACAFCKCRDSLVTDDTSGISNQQPLSPPVHKHALLKRYIEMLCMTYA